MEHLLSSRQPLTPIVFDYAKFLISSKRFDDQKAYGPIVQRLGFKTESFLSEMKKFSTEVPTMKGTFVIDKMTEDSLVALSMLLRECDEKSELRSVLQKYLLSVLSIFLLWKGHGRFMQAEFTETIFTSLFKCLNASWEAEFFALIRKFVDTALNEANDVELYGNIASFIFRGFLNSPKAIGLSALEKIIAECIRILDSSIYDLRVFLPEAPPGTPLNELLRKYFILPASALAATFHSLRSFKNANAGVNVDCEKLCIALVTYTSSIGTFLAQCETFEAELAGLLKLILKMLKIIVNVHASAIDDSFAVIQMSLQSRADFRNPLNYRELLADSCQLLLECTKLKSELLQNSLSCLRDAVVSLDIVPAGSEGVEVNYFEMAASIGPYIGSLFRLHLDHGGDRDVCESILNSMLSSMPEEALDASHSADFGSVCSHAVATLGHIAGIAGDDQIALSCLASLTAQFNKRSYGEVSRVFFTQFNLIAVTGAGSLLANILDIYTNIISEGESELVYIAMDELSKSLVLLCKHDMIKLEVLLFTLMRAFIEKALVFVKKPVRKGSSAVSELRPVLLAIWSILQYAVIEDFINKAASTDLFQEFWFVLLFHGYQTNLKWDTLWIDFIPRIAQKSPLLIKEKDRIQTASTISLSILTQLVTPSLKNHLISLMPNCASSARNISQAQCLWLLTFYQCEKFKLEQGNTETFLRYLQSDVVYYLDLYPFIEDLSLSIVKDWLGKFMIKKHSETTKLALLVLHGCGHIQKRIHKTCLQFLKLILSRERGLEGCTAIWIGLLDKIDFLYKTCRAEMGMLPDSVLTTAGDYIKDPDYAKEAFDDVLQFSREVFQTASYLYPHEYYSFVMNHFQYEDGPRVSNQVSYRDVSLLELLKSCHPDSPYFDLPLDMHRNSESHFKWHLLLPKLKAAPVTEFDASVLQVESLWKKRSEFTSNQVQEMMTFILQKLESGNVDYNLLRCLVHLPFLTSDYKIMQYACNLWTFALKHVDAKKADIVIAEINAAFNLHVEHQLGIFNPMGKCVDPFKTKFNSTPSKPGKLEAGVTVSTYYLYLIDFIRERFLLDSRSRPQSLNLYADFILRLLNATRHFQYHSWSRAARFRAILLGYEILSFLRNFWSDRFGTETYAIKSALYRSFVDYFERPKTFSNQSKDLFEYEVRTITALLDYLERDSTVPATMAENQLLQVSMESLFLNRSGSTNFESKDSLPVSGSASQQPQSPKASSATLILSLRQLLRHLLLHENESILVWIGRFKAYKMTLPPRAFWRELAVFARRYSPLLALRFCEMVKLDPEHALLIEPTGSPKSQFWRYLHSVELIEHFIKARLEIPSSIEALLYSAPLSPPLALSIFRTEPYKSSPKYLNYAMRSLESYQPELLFFYIPQIVQNLRHDDIGYTQATIMHIVAVSPLFAHQMIWNMKANMYIDDAGTIPDPMKPILEATVSQIVHSLQGSDRVFYEREFEFFDKVTGISGLLKPFISKEKWEKKRKIDEELGRIAVDAGVYLPSNPECSVIDIDYTSGRPLQSQAKAPFMATFKVQSLTDPKTAPTWQSCIFKVGDDCRQDVMTLQIISSIKSIFEMHNLHLYLFPYRVVATAPGCGVIEVIPNSISRDMLGREKINSLYEYFWFKYGNPNGLAFQTAREEFIKSMAAYSVITYLVAIRDRHNGNIMIDDQGHIIHIDFGFVLDIGPGGMIFEKSPFKLTSEMIQVMGGKEDSSPYFVQFQNYCVQAFLLLRPFAEQLIQLVDGVKESGLPCFKIGEATIKNLRQRFRLDLDEAEARTFFANLVNQSCENVRTDMYDAFQSYRNGIPY